MTTTSDDATTIDALTPRQEQVIRLIAAGRTNPQIATELDISIDGVKWHVRELMSKLAAESRDEAVATWQAQQRGARTRKVSRFAAIAVGLAGVVAAAGVVLVVVVNQDAGDPSPAANNVESVQVWYADDRGDLELVPLTLALMRFRAEAGFAPLLLPANLVAPLTPTEMRADVSPTEVPNSLTHSQMQYARPGDNSNSDLRIEVDLMDVRGRGGAGFTDLPNSTTLGSRSVTVRYGTAEEVGRSSDDYAFELEGIVYTIRVSGPNRPDSTTMLTMLAAALTTGP